MDFIKATFGNAGTLIQALEPPREPVNQDPFDGKGGGLSQPIYEEPQRPFEDQASPNGSTPTTAPPPEGLHTTQPVGQSEHPLSASVEQSTPPTSYSDETHPTEPSTSQEPMVALASPAPEVAPTHPTDAITSQPNAPSGDTAHETMNAGTTQSAEPFSMQPRQPGKYEGLTYSAAHQHYGLAFKWPSKDEWLSDGGTLDNFYA